MKYSSFGLVVGAVSLNIAKVFALTDCAYSGYSLKDSFASANASTYIGCSTACFGYSQCKSFAFDPSGDCQLYDIPVDNNLDLDYSSWYKFWDIACETDPSCGWPGDDYRASPFDYVKGGTEKNCIDKCIGLTNCKSYAYGNGECFLYDVPVKGNYNGRNNSPYLFYDRLCIKSGTSTSTTTAKTTTKATTSPSTTLSTSKQSTTVTTSGQGTSTTKTSTTTGQSITTTKSSTSVTSSSMQSTSTIKQSTTSTSQNTSTTIKQSNTTNSTSSTTTKQSTTTTTKQATTTITISSQPYFCTAV